MKVIFRAIGPSLRVNGQPVEGRLKDPVLELYNRNGVLLATNDNWKDDPQAGEVEQSNLAPRNERESALARTLTPGVYTAIIRGKDNTSGIGLVEAYDRGHPPRVEAEMANISTRGFVDTGDNAMIGGFITGGRPGATRIVVRGLGPSLTNKGVPDALQDPVIQLINANGSVIRSNDNWREAPNRDDIAARGLAPKNDRESALLQTVQPGDYTVILRGKPNAPAGNGLVEIYNVD